MAFIVLAVADDWMRIVSIGSLGSSEKFSASLSVSVLKVSLLFDFGTSNVWVDEEEEDDVFDGEFGLLCSIGFGLLCILLYAFI